MRGHYLILLLLGQLTFSAQAMAYCRTTTCAQTEPPADCLPLPADGECQMAGEPLAWGKSCVSFSVQADGSVELGITAADLEDVVQLSFDNWQNSTCTGGGTPGISITAFPQVQCSEVRYNTDSKNQNLWTFRDGAWPHYDPTNSMIALTSVTFDKDSGEIYDVDVELNSANYDFQLESTVEGTDLQSVVQHESGHVLGLAHSDVANATMYYSYDGNVDMRTLESDDIDGLCAVYPPVSEADASCDPTPRHGFSTKCYVSDDGCSVGRAGSGTSKGLLVLLGASVLTAWLRRRRKLG